MEFQFDVRSKTYIDRTWDDTVQFCIDHDHWIPHNYQKHILEIASEYGVYRKLSMLEDGKGMRLHCTLPSNDMFSEWLAKRIDYYHEVNDSETDEERVGSIPYFPNSFQKRCWELTEFTPLIPEDLFWIHLHKAFMIAKHECRVNIHAFNLNARMAYAIHS